MKYIVVVGTLNPFLSVPCTGSRTRLDLGVQTGAVVGSGGSAALLKTSTLTKRSGLELHRRRSKRSVFLHSGVRICPQDTINEVLASHQAYYHLRGTELLWSYRLQEHHTVEVELNEVKSVTLWSRWRRSGHMRRGGAEG